MTKPDPNEIGREVAEFVLKLAKESERSAVILGAAQIDNFLERYLKSFMKNHPDGKDNLFDQDRPLATFSAKIAIALRLGAITPEFEHALQMIRKIRNDFAHSLESERLSESRHRDRIREVMKDVRGDLLFKYIDPPIRKQIESVDLADFCSAAAIICADLELGILHAKALDVGWCVSFNLPGAPA